MIQERGQHLQAEAAATLLGYYEYSNPNAMLKNVDVGSIAALQGCSQSDDRAHISLLTICSTSLRLAQQLGCSTLSWCL
jgi:hypothetical protein